MKARWIISFLVIAGIMTSVPLKAQDVGAANTVMNYFEACRSGNVDEIKSLITGPFYAKKSALLNDNAEYANFLKEHFDGVNVEIVSETPNNTETEADVTAEQHYPNGALLRTRFMMRYIDDTWKIYDEKLVDE